MDYFVRKSGTLYCEDLPIKELVLQYGTPLYLYSYRTLERHFRVFSEALADIDHTICYAVKANGNIAILRALANFGSGADVVSGGELFRSITAEIDPRKIIFSGVGKTIPEIEYALRRKIYCLNVESGFELRQIADVASKLAVKAPVALRLNPDVDPKTHPYISTGLHENKFGLSQTEAIELYREASKNPHLDPIGLGFHIGSQLTQTQPFVDAAKIAVELVRTLRKSGIDIRHLDCGGGLGVRYRDETPPNPKEYASALLPLVQNMGLKLIVEPGRSLIANAGVLVSRVLHVKRTPKKNFVVIDTGMNDLLRPALYDAEHEIEWVSESHGERIRADIVGPICETADFLARDREINEPMEGDLLAIRTAGAYGFSMSSQYNARPRAAEVLVRNGEASLIRKRETFDDLIAGEEIPSWLGAKT